MLFSADTWKHAEFFFSGATVLGLIGHAVNTFPTPKNIYGQWLLGVVKFAVGQRQSALNAMRGTDTFVATVPLGQGGTGTGTGQTSTSESTQVRKDGDAVKISTEKVVRSETVVSPPPPPEKGN